MATLQEFIDYLNEQVKNHSIYVWGAQGQKDPTITEAWIRAKEDATTNAARAIRFWNAQCNAGYKKVLRAFDCSGLGVYFLYDLKKVISGDMSAHTLKGNCAQLSKGALKRGDWVFRVDASGKAYHIGYIVDSDLNVVEAKGRDDGVVKRGLCANGSSYWNWFGRPKWFKAEIEKGATNVNSGWQQTNGKWYYYKNGKAVTGWAELEWSQGKSWFYFDSAGVMQTGWKQLKWSGGTDRFYFDGNGAMQTGWLKDKNDWYYLMKDGNMAYNCGVQDAKDKSKLWWLGTDGKMYASSYKLILV